MPSSINATSKKNNLKKLGLKASQRKRLARCGQQSIKSGGKRVTTISCNLAVCPRCSARRDRERQAAIQENMVGVLSEHRDAIYYSITLKAAHNTKYEHVRRRARGLHKSFKDMERTKDFKALNMLGYLRSIEVKKTGVDVAYPHLHFLVAFEPQAFSLDVLHERLTRYFGIGGYHLKRIETTSKYSDLEAAIIGFARYLAKGMAGVIDSFKSVYDSFFQVVATALRGLRRFAAGGIFKSVLAAIEKDGVDIADGEILQLVCEKTGSITEAAYEKAKGLWGSFGLGRRRKKQKKKALELPRAAVAVSDDRYSKPVARNRVKEALDAFDAMLKKGVNSP